MRLIIVGCGRVGSELAQSVAQDEHEVVVIDRNPQAFLRLGHDFHGRTLQGDVMDYTVLERADIEQADGFAAVTPIDETNLVASRSAREVFKVPNVVARVHDPIHARLFYRLGLQTVVSSSWGAHRIAQLLTHPGLTELASVGNGEVMFVEVRIPEHLAGKSLRDLGQDNFCQPAALVRGGRAELARPETTLERGDLVVLSVLASRLSELQAMLHRGEG
jgi:trk system potassium uptake protein TrkA